VRDADKPNTLPLDVMRNMKRGEDLQEKLPDA